MSTRHGLAAAVGPLAALALILGFFFLARSFGSDAEALGPLPNAVPNKGVTATVVAPTLAQPPSAPSAPSPLSPPSPFAQPPAPPVEGTTILVSARGPGSGAPFRPGFGSAVTPSTPFPKPTISTPAKPQKPAKPTKSAKPKKHAKHDKADKPAKTHGPKADKPKKSGASKAAKPDKGSKGKKPEKAAKPEKSKGGKSKKH